MSRPNTAAPADQPSPSTRRHTRLFAVITVAITVVLGLASVEWGLRWLGRSPDLDERLDVGLFTYHPKVGWALTPGWNGRHRTIDFDVRYSVNRSGHRGTTVEAVKPAGQRRIAYLGDSFTFATGVEDAETFTEVLNRADAPATVHLNFGLPGTSTDQHVLFAEERLALFEPDVIVLVVYLANDLLDNLAAYPLQVDFAKPYFELRDGELVLQGVPVPRTLKPAAVKARSYADAVNAKPPPLAPLIERSEIARRLAAALAPVDQTEHFATHHAPSVDLFDALVRRLQTLAQTKRAELVVALLPGKSFVDDPAGPSAQYQEMVRRAIIERLDDSGIAVIDVASALRRAYGDGRRDLYHPREGHFSAAGNRFVAKVLSEGLPPPATAGQR